MGAGVELVGARAERTGLLGDRHVHYAERPSHKLQSLLKMFGKNEIFYRNY